MGEEKALRNRLYILEFSRRPKPCQRGSLLSCIELTADVHVRSDAVRVCDITTLQSAVFTVMILSFTVYGASVPEHRRSPQMNGSVRIRARLGLGDLQ